MATLRTQLEIRNAAKGKHRVVTSSGSCGFEKRTSARDTGSYYVRLSIGGKEIVMGLGRFGELGAVEACEAAAAERARARKGVNPIAERDRVKAANLAAERKAVTCREAAKVFFDKTKGAWRGRYYAQSWWSQMVRFAFPVVGDIPIGDLLSEHIAAIRMATNDAGAPSTGQQIQSRLGEVADMAVACGWRGAALRNPADARQVDAFLPAKRSQGEPNHFRRIAIDDAPAAFQALIEAGKQAQGAAQSGLAAWAFMATSALRPAEARNTSWSEVDLGARLVTIAAERTKGNRTHAVPLSELALEILLRQAAIHGTSGFVFPGRSGGPVSHTAFTHCVDTVGVDVGTAHSWRSIFADWATERGSIAPHLVEMALAHTLTAVQRAYVRGSATDIRRPAMESYGKWLVGADAADVITLNDRRA
jgi:integrase